jgi:hypothetical protein
MDSSEFLTRVQQLLASLPGPYGNGLLQTLLDYEHADGPVAQVFAFVSASSAGPGADAAFRQHVPRDELEFTSVLREVDLDGARLAFESMTTRTLAYRTPGRYSAANAASVFRALAQLLGRQARWLTNTNGTTWRPVTSWAMDTLFIGTGNGILVAILVTDED